MERLRDALERRSLGKLGKALGKLGKLEEALAKLMLAESFLLSAKCPLGFFKTQIVRENYWFEKSKRDSVSL